MPRAKRKRQAFHFPQADQPSAPQDEFSLTDAELDAAIDGGSDTASAVSLNKVREKSKAKNAVAEAVKQIPEIFTPEQVAWAFDVYVVLICFVFSILLKCDFKLLHDELKLDEDVKLMWAKPLARVVSKYAPTEWAGMTAEIELIGCLGIWTATAFGRARGVVQKEAERKEAEKRERARNPITAMPQQHERQSVPV
jgi:hypothetical protein